MDKRKRLTLKEKLKILDDYTNGNSVSGLAIKYGLAKSTICTILKNKPKLLNNMKKTNFGSKHRSAIKDGGFPIMENKLFKWFQMQRKQHVPISGEILKLKAKEFHNQDYNGNFKASNGWLTRFKKRFGIRLLKQCGEKLSAREELVEPFKKELHKIIHDNDLSEEAIFNADETGLFWKMLPDRTYVHAEENSAPGRKMAKERITLLLCANASGSKIISPLLIGKAQNPRSFKNKVLPLDYAHSKNAWMTSLLFKNWFHEKFVPEVNFCLLLS